MKTRKIFVIGQSKTGKTTVSKKIYEIKKLSETKRTNSTEETKWDIYGRIEASDWIKRLHPEISEELPDYRKIISKISLIELSKNPNACIEWLSKSINCGKEFYEIHSQNKKEYSEVNINFILSGIRNPYDFGHLFDAQKDIVVFLEPYGNHLSYEGFDRYIPLIKEMVQSFVKLGIVKEENVIYADTRVGSYFNGFEGNSLFETATNAGIHIASLIKD